MITALVKVGAGFARNVAPGDVLSRPKISHRQSKLGLQRPRTLRLSYGYRRTNPVVDALVNRSTAAAALLIASPAMLTIALALLVTQGTSILYAGTRVGPGGTRFNIYKFRTLDSEKAARLTTNGVLPRGTKIETPLGGFLRATRLDELPQLFNVLNGSMVLFGPRPVRPEIAALRDEQDQEYDVSMDVKPGMIGFAQALMSHGTEKRHRAQLNRRLCQQEVSYVAALVFLARVGIHVARRSVAEIFSRSKAERVGLERCPEGMAISYQDVALPIRSTRGGDIFVDRAPGLRALSRFNVLRRLPSGKVRKARLVVTSIREEDRLIRISFEPATGISRYFVDRYFLHDVVIPPTA